jgi:hypothetical protein
MDGGNVVSVGEGDTSWRYWAGAWAPKVKCSNMMRLVPSDGQLYRSLERRMGRWCVHSQEGRNTGGKHTLSGRNGLGFSWRRRQAGGLSVRV